MLAGLVCIAISIAFSNSDYAAALLSDSGRDLSWGPALFRVVLLFHGLVFIGYGLMRARGFFETKLPNAQTESEPTSRLAIGILLILSVCAIALRLWNLNSDLWIDEVLTLLDFVRKPLGEIVTSFPSQNQHMLFSILAHVSTNIFGESAWSLRLPSVLFGVISIWPFFFLCKRLVGEREALLATALMTFSYHHVWFSQNARGYMGLLLFTILSTWCWIEALESNRPRWWFAYGASVVLGMWIHPTMAFSVAAHGLVYTVFWLFPAWTGTAGPRERRVGLAPLVTWLFAVTVTLQLYALSLPEFLAVGLHEESSNSEWTKPFWVITETIRGLSIGFSGTAVVICGAGFVAFGWYKLFQKDRNAALIMVLPAVLAGGTMLALGHNIWPRFFFFSMGFGILIVIHGAVQLPKTLVGLFADSTSAERSARYAGVGFALALIAMSLVTLPRNYALPKQSFAMAKDYVETHRSPGDTTVAVNLAGIVYGGYLKPFWPVVKTGAELESMEQGNDRIWLVYTLPIEVKAVRPELWQMIETEYDVVKVFPGTLNGGEVFVCRKKLNQRGQL